MTKHSLHLLLFLIALLATTGLRAQSSPSDSLRIEGYYEQLSQYCYTQLDSTLYYLDVLLEETEQLGWTEEQAYAYLWGILCTGYHDQIDLKYELLSAAEQLLADRSGELPADILAAIDVDLRMHWGDYYMETGGYQGALDIYESLASTLENMDSLSDESFQRLVIAYQYLATIHRLRGSYKESIDYAFQALRYERAYYARQGRQAVDESFAYSRIANAYWLMGERQLALHYYRNAFRQGMDAFRAAPAKNTRIRKRLINMGVELGSFYRELDRPDSALFFLEQISPYSQPADPLTQEIRLEKAQIWSAADNQQRALDTLRSAMENLEQHPQQRGNQILLGQLYRAEGDIRTGQGNSTAALRAYQRALTCLNQEFSATDPAQNPPASTDLAPKELLRTLIQKTALLVAGPPDTSEKWLNIAWSTALTGMDLIDSIRLSYTSDYDKQYLLEESYVLYELALQIAHQMGSAYAIAAFDVMERSKTVAMYAAVRDLHARSYAQVPETALERMQQLRYQLSKIDSELEQLASEEKQIDLRQQKVRLQRTYQDLITTFERDYPEYYRLKYQQQTPDLTDPAVAELLAGQLLIEYFIGKDQLYVCTVQDRKVTLRQLHWNAELTRWAVELKDDIYQGNDEAYRKKAVALYRALLAPVLPATASGRLIIVPDGVLGYLPFDVLLTASPPPSGSNDFRTYPFLLREWTTSQHFSLKMLLEMQTGMVEHEAGMLAVAPSFPRRDVLAERSDRAVLGELLFNEEEAQAALQSFQGQLLADRDATEGRFLELASRYRIYHIASHAVINDRFPQRSYIAFSSAEEQESDESTMYSYEILAQSFPADLVVLSACETAIGQVQRGEGIMSLARAFSYAGARSLITSLWNVNDQSSARLMAEFYRQLSAGSTKDEALRQAKLTYLDNAPDNARTHPRYWAAFLPTGNMEAITGSGYEHWWVLTIAGIGFLYFISRKKTS